MINLKTLLVILFVLAALPVSVSRAGVQDVFIFCPDELAPGSQAAFRVVVKEARALDDSRPLAGAKVEIELTRPGYSKRLIKSVTDNLGTVSQSAEIPRVSPGDDYELVVRVSSSLGKEEKKHRVNISPRYKVLLSVDKPLYQPGQLIHIRAVALNLADLSPVPTADVVLEVEDPQGNKVFKQKGSSDRFGIFAADFQLADEIRLGDYLIRAVVAGREVERAVTVKRYVLPDFKVMLTTEKPFYRPGEVVSGTVSANYFFGKPVDGGQVKVSALAFDVEFRTVAEVTGRTDQDGNFIFEIELPDYFAGQPLEAGDAFVRLDAEVIDKAEHKETATTQRKVAETDLRIEIVPEAGRIVPGVENTIYAVVTTADDQPAKADVTLTVAGKTYTAKTDDTGIALITITAKNRDLTGSAGNYLLAVSASAKDARGRAAQTARDLSTQSLADGVLLRTDRAIYTSGDDMEVTVLSTFNKGSVYLDVIKDSRTLLTRALDFQAGRAFDRIALGPDIFGTIELHAYVIMPSGEITRDARVIYVEQSDGLNISVSLDKDTYRPGEEARLNFKVTDEKGRGRMAALGMAVVDESVFAIQDMQPGLLKAYFTLEKELAKPRYEIHFAPGGRTVESIILDRGETEARRDRVMRVLLAGVENPTTMGWRENPAQARRQEEKQMIQQFALAFFQWACQNQFLERGKDKQWTWKKDIARQMVKDKAITEEQALDSFGNFYDPSVLVSLDPALDLRTVSNGMASYRLQLLYQALYRYQQSDQRSWLDKLFAGSTTAELSESAIDAVIEKEYLDQGSALDPWGRRFVITRLQEEANSPFSQTFKNYDIRSAGPDGKTGTDDDVTQPYAYNNVPFLNNLGVDFWKNEDGMMMRGMKALGYLGGADAEFDKRAAKVPMPMMAMAGEEPPSPSGPGKNGGPAIRVREYFPETLWWEPALITDRAGNAGLTMPMADSITTWRLTALGHSTDGLLGSAVSGIRVFQDFFVDIDFPVQLTQGDEVEIPVQVYNYLPGSQRVTLEVREHDGFELLSEPVKKLTLSEGQVDVRYFRVKATRVGRQSLTVYATGSKMSDAVKRSVDVIPDGLRVEVVKNGRLTGPLTELIEIPDFAIDDASRVVAKIYPGVFSQVVEGLDGIFRLPSGCFEQTTSTTYPNVMVLAYMKKTGTAGPEIQMKAEGFINAGYQRLLSFEVPGGGFEWFGTPPAHKVLTAYGLMEFYDMSRVYNIDEAVITRTQQWLVDQQERDGTWKPVEHWLETLSGEDFSRSLELNTAYIAWALAESGYRGEPLDRSIRYLENNLEKMKDAYSLALAVNAMIAANPADADARELLRRLDGLKIEDKKTGTVHWEPAGETAVHGGGNSAMIETTSLIIYAMIKAGVLPATANKGLAWLSLQKDGFGTFQSTQATILAFKALLAAEAQNAPDVNGEITVSMGRRRETITITPENSEVLRMVDFKDQTRAGNNEVSFKAPQDMGLMYQVLGIYYVPWSRVETSGEKELLSLGVKYDRTRLKTNDLLTAAVTAAYNGGQAADMIILDLGIPPGFSLVPDGLDKLKRENAIEKYTATGRQLTLYVRRMESGKPLVFSYQLKAKFPVKAQTPKSAAYEYYNPDHKTEAPPEMIEVTR